MELEKNGKDPSPLRWHYCLGTIYYTMQQNLET